MNLLAQALLGGTQGASRYLQGRQEEENYFKRLDRLNEAKRQQSLADKLLKEQSFERAGLPKEYANLDTSLVKQLLEQPKPAKPIGAKDISSLLSLSLDKNQVQQYGLDALDTIANRANELSPQYGPEKASILAIQEYNRGTLFPEKQEEIAVKEEIPSQDKRSQESFFSPALKGFQSGAFGRASAIAQGIPYEEYEKSNQLQNPSLINSLLFGAGRFGGEFPLYGVGGSLGASLGAAGGPIGATVGGSAGALALPAMVDTALEEYHKYLSQGGDKGFESFVEGVNKTIQSGARGGAEGVIFGTVGKLIPQLKQIKALEPIFAKKGAETFTKTALQTGAITGARGIAEQRVPTSDEVVKTFAELLGFNLFEKLPKKTASELVDKIRNKNVSPEKAAKDVANYIEDNKLDPNKSSDVIKAVENVTRTYKGPEREAAKSVLDVLGKIEVEEPKKKAEKIAERPSLKENIEKYEATKKAAEKPLTEKETLKRETAAKEANILEKDLSRIEEDITALKNVIESPGKGQDSRLYKSALEAKMRERDSVTEKLEDMRSVAKSGVEPFRPSRFEEPIQKHMKELEEASKNPESLTAQSWKQMFERDQKYVNEFMKILQKGELPEAPFKDRYIKTLELYQDAYKNQLENIKKLINERENEYKALKPQSKKAKEMKSDLNALKNLENMTSKNFDINKAKIGKQKEKISQLYEIKKPGSALLKHYLKSMRPDIESLQKDFITQRKQFNQAEKIADKISKESMKEVNDLIKEYQKNPNKVNLRKVAESTNVSIEKLENAKVAGKNIAQDIVESIKNGDAKSKIESFVQNQIDEALKGLTELGKAGVHAIITSEIQDFILNTVGIKIPYASAIPIVGFITSDTRRWKTFGIGAVYKQLKNKLSMYKQKSAFKKLNTPKQKSDFIDRLKKDGFSSKEIKYIIG